MSMAGAPVEILDRVRSAERRLRTVRAIRVGAWALCAAWSFAIALVALRKFHGIGERGVRQGLAGLAAAVVAATLVAYVWPVARFAGARVLDRFHGFHDRLASALEFSEMSSATRTLFMVAAIDDAISLARTAQPPRAVPLRVPRAFGLALLLAGCCLWLSRLEIRERVSSTVEPHMIDPFELAPDDIDEVREFLERAKSNGAGEEVKTAAVEIERLVDDIAAHRIDRTETFRRIEGLDRKLSEGRDVDPQVVARILERIGHELEKAELSRRAGEALAKSRLDEAADELRRLSAHLRRPSDRPSSASIERLRGALEKAAAQVAQRRQELDEQRRRVADDLLKRRASAADAGEEGEHSLVDRQQRELERLDRDIAAESEAERSLEQLDRELEQAAADLAKDLGISADEIGRSAEDVHRVAGEQMTRREKEELRDKLRELRDLARQQPNGADGQRRLVQVRQFGRSARGESGGPSGSDGVGGSEGSAQDRAMGEADGAPGAAGESPQRNAQGGAEGAATGGETWILGPNGEKVLMLSKGPQGQGQSPPGAEGESGQAMGGRTWGNGHDPNIRGKATQLKATTVDTDVSGADTGQGGSRRQVIHGAAQRGFVSRAYKNVFREYETVAEVSLAKEEIPGGYRFFVKRYFQLIRPRDGQ